MINLLSANLVRLKANGIFRVCILASIFFGVICPLLGWDARLQGFAVADQVRLDYYFFKGIVFLVLILALFCGIYVGMEYKNGTFRNKLVVGHTRSEIYVSNLLTNMAAALVFCTVYFIVSFFMGRNLIGKFRHFTQQEVLLYIMSAYVLMLCCAAIFTMISMLNADISRGTLFSMGIGLLFAMGGALLFDRLTDAVWVLAAGEIVVNIMLYLCDFFPGGQMMEFFWITDELSDLSTMHPSVMLEGSAVFAAAAVLIGWLGFRRREMK